jgi:hypothetical protein
MELRSERLAAQGNPYAQPRTGGSTERSARQGGSTARTSGSTIIRLPIRKQDEVHFGGYGNRTV